MFEAKKEFLSGTDPKISFLLGLFIGVSVISIIALAAILIKGAPDSGALAVNNEAPIDNNELSNNNEVKEEVAADVPAVSSSDYIRGDKNAPVTVITYSDFQCPYCERFHTSMSQVMKDYSGKVRWIYRNFPLTSLHPQAQKAAEAYECAAEQGKYAEYADALFENQSSLGDALFAKLAGDLKMDTKKFSDCLSSGKYKSKISAQAQGGAAAGVQGTPASFINGEFVSGAVPYDSLKTIIDGKL